MFRHALFLRLVSIASKQSKKRKRKQADNGDDTYKERMNRGRVLKKNKKTTAMAAPNYKTTKTSQDITMKEKEKETTMATNYKNTKTSQDITMKEKEKETTMATNYKTIEFPQEDPKKRGRVVRKKNRTITANYKTMTFPQDIITEIFSRLPLLTILNLRLPSIMLCREFERMFLRYSSRRRTTFFVVSESHRHRRKNTKLQDQIIEYHHGEHRVVSKTLDSTELFFGQEYQSESSSSYKVLGCCNGLFLHGKIPNMIAGRNRYGSLHLLNPITRRFVKLPDYSLWVRYGLGYSSKTRLYKVVKLIDKGRNSVKVLTVDLNNAENNIYCWRSCLVASDKNQLTCEDFRWLFYHLESPVPLHGAIHWLTTNRKNCILRFNIDEEEFDFVPLPYKGEGVYHRYTQLTVLNGSICLLNDDRADILKQYEVWTMKEYGVKESWTRLVTINLGILDDHTLNVINVLEDGKLLIRIGPILRLYDPKEEVWDNKKGKRIRMSKFDDMFTNFIMPLTDEPHSS